MPDSVPPSSRPGERFPATLPYGVLNAKRPKTGPDDRGYDEAVLRQLTDMYLGGFTMKEAAKQYLPKSPDETQKHYDERTKNPVAFINYLGRIVGYYAALVFSKQLSIQPATDANGKAEDLPEPDVYEAFAKDADLKGSSLVDTLKQVFTWALVTQKAFLCVDFPAPPPGVPVASVAEEKAFATDRPYAYFMHAARVLDWEYDTVVHRAGEIRTKPGAAPTRFEWSYGRLKWCVTKSRSQEREGVAVKREKPREEFKVWEKGDDGVVRWATYRTEPAKGAETDPKWTDNDPCERTGQGEVSFQEIPILELVVPADLWIGNLVGELNLEHWRRRSRLVGEEDRAIHSILYFKYGPQLGSVGGSMPSHKANDAGRGKSPATKAQEHGAVQMDSQDDIGFAEPSGGAFSIVEQQIDKIGDICFQLAAQMHGSLVASTSALGRSGESKAEDRNASTIVASAYGEIVRDVAVRAYTVIARARGESVQWAAHGMDDYSSPDRAAAIEEATQIPAIGIPSPTAKRLIALRLVGDILPGASPEDMTKIKAELDANITDEPAELPPQEA